MKWIIVGIIVLILVAHCVWKWWKNRPSIDDYDPPPPPPVFKDKEWKRGVEQIKPPNTPRGRNMYYDFEDRSTRRP